jgi:hypothetical protein
MAYDSSALIKDVWLLCLKFVAKGCHLTHIKYLKASYTSSLRPAQSRSFSLVPVVHAASIYL